jgi:hypothetical protein
VPNEVVATLKGDGSAPWVVAHGEEVHDAERLIEDSLKGSFFQTVAEASTLFSAAVKVANGFDPNAPAEPNVTNDGYRTGGGKPPYQQRQQVGQNQQGNYNNNQQSSFNGTPHPEGKTCPMCNAPIVGKQPKVKKMWTCPNQRQNGDGHYVEWING